MDKIFKKFDWYIKRLSLMSPAEVLYRILNVSMVLSEKLTFTLKLFKTKKLKRLNIFFLNQDDILFLREFYKNRPEIKQAIIEKSNELLKHKFSYFALNAKSFGAKIDWHRDYLNDKTANKAFYSDIKLQNPPNIKYIWELNRFQHFFTLAQAYSLSEEEKYAQEIINQISDWIEENPYLTGVNWKSSLEMSLRIISWGWAIHVLCLSGYKFDDLFMKKLGESVFLQAEYIKRHFSRYSSANNHLIGEAAGLIAAGSMFAFGKTSDNWIKKGYSILQQEINKQFSNEGFNREQSFSYHCFTCDFYMLSFLLLKAKGLELKESFKKKFEQICSATYYMVDDRLNYFNLGDSDDGFVLKINSDSIKDSILSIFNFTSLVFDKPVYDFLPENLDEKNLWLLGRNGYDKYAQINRIKLQKDSKHLKDSGYFLFNSNDIKAIMDIGPLGYLSIVAHGHADMLSFCLNYKNREFLVDTGTFCYHENPNWRKHFKGTSAHNTVSVDKINQSEIGGNFMWMKKADIKIESIKKLPEKDYVKASHNGFVKQGKNVIHTREILFNKPNKFFIFDSFEILDNQEHRFDMYWHLHPNCTVEKNDYSASITNDNETIHLQVSSDTLLYFKLINGCVSRSFGNLELTKVLKNTFVTSKNTKILTLIYFS